MKTKILIEIKIELCNMRYVFTIDKFIDNLSNNNYFHEIKLTLHLNLRTLLAEDQKYFY